MLIPCVQEFRAPVQYGLTGLLPGTEYEVWVALEWGESNRVIITTLTIPDQDPVPESDQPPDIDTSTSTTPAKLSRMSKMHTPTTADLPSWNKGRFVSLDNT